MVAATVRWLMVAILIATGGWLAFGGSWLLILGGSAYYLLAGIASLATGILLAIRRPLAIWVYSWLLGGTAIWAIFEAGMQFWSLLPRVAGPLSIGIILALPWFRRGLKQPAGAPATLALSATTAASALLLLVSYITSKDWQQANSATGAAQQLALSDTPAGSDQWFSYGRTTYGTRYSPADQITPANVNKLKVAWTYRTGDLAKYFSKTTGQVTFEATPLMVENRVYVCSGHNIVAALDAETGKQIWSFDPKVDSTGALTVTCRGVSYHQSSKMPEDANCRSRILMGTIDGRMFALDARTGARCTGFGGAGEISLHEDMGKVDPGAHYVTSPPVVIGDVAVVGGYILDNYKTGEPAGVVRAYDVVSGKRLWAWDTGAPDDAPGVAPYTRGSPNAWSVFSADPVLGLVYVPTGNATPDYVGMHRSPALERYASSVVALDAVTGSVRWHFQTVHHDLWDYDVPAQPVLADFPTSGGTAPAVFVPTKRGEIFVLDRRTGKPLAEVEERSVPIGSLPGETYSPTQPYSVGFPSLAPDKLVESDMWGMTPLDQLWCRLEFRRHDYVGDFTPQSTRGAIQSPGNFGAINWGSVSIDERRQMLIANSSSLPLLVKLVPRTQADRIITGDHHGSGLQPQKGTPYAAEIGWFLSPLGIPCTAPPWGHLTGIDLKTRKIAWQRPLGDTRQQAPLGISIPGIFGLGGSVITKGGVTFIAATIDGMMRGFDTATGKLLWSDRLPTGGLATPMTYTAKSGKQFLVIAAGGNTTVGLESSDYVVAYALDE